MITQNKPVEPEDADNILAKLISETAAGKLRWGFQPPSTAQSNRGNIHYVLRLRRNVYRLTARRDGGKRVNFTIERNVTEAASISELFRLAVGEKE